MFFLERHEGTKKEEPRELKQSYDSKQEKWIFSIKDGGSYKIGLSSYEKKVLLRCMMYIDVHHGELSQLTYWCLVCLVRNGGMIHSNC